MAPHCHCGEPSPDSGGNCLERDDGISSLARTTPTPWLRSLAVHFGLIGLPLCAFQYVLLRDAFIGLISWQIYPIQANATQSRVWLVHSAATVAIAMVWLDGTVSGGAHAPSVRHAPGLGLEQCVGEHFRPMLHAVLPVRLAGNGQVSSHGL